MLIRYYKEQNLLLDDEIRCLESKSHPFLLEQLDNLARKKECRLKQLKNHRNQFLNTVNHRHEMYIREAQNFFSGKRRHLRTELIAKLYHDSWQLRCEWRRGAAVSG